MQAPTFIRWWFAWALLILSGVTGYGVYMAMADNYYPPLRAFVVGSLGGVLAALPVLLWRRR